MIKNRPTLRTDCEHHEEAGSCTQDCRQLLYDMTPYVGDDLPYDPTGCSNPAPRPEFFVHLDEVNHLVMVLFVHPEDCTCYQDFCPLVIEDRVSLIAYDA